MILTLASVGMFVALMQRLGLLQVSQLLTFTGDFGRRVIEQMYPPLETPARTILPDELSKLSATHTVTHTGAPLELQAIDLSALMALAMKPAATVEVVASVGDTLITGSPLLRVFDGTKIIEDDFWKRTFETGLDRTFEQDPQYALRLLVDIAIEALSPAVNDPTTGGSGSGPNPGCASASRAQASGGWCLEATVGLSG
jgi:uncharacterized membrane protein